MGDYDDDKKELISSFNEAKFQIYRLHISWLTCNTLSQAGDIIKWKWKLDTIWRELSPDAKEKDGYKEKSYGEWIKEKGKDKYISQITEINQKISEAKDDAGLYAILQEKEIFLRCLQDNVGKGSKKSSVEEDDIDE